MRSIGSLLLVTIVGMASVASTRTVKLSAVNVVASVEGIIYGVMKQQFPSGALEKCVMDTTPIESNLVAAVKDFESLSFDGIKKGINEAGAAIKAIPGMVKDCQGVPAELDQLVKMAEVFEHPLSLLFQVGKSLIVNGADIFQKVKDSVTAYKSAKYFEFGENLGMALDIVFLKSSSSSNSQTVEVKRPIDEKAYGFLSGFFQAIEGVEFDQEHLYNEIDGKGVMVYGPVQAAMRSLNASNGEMTQRVWIGIHEVEHIFKEGGEILVYKQVLTKESLEVVRATAACLDEKNVNAENTFMASTFIRVAMENFEEGNHYKLGQSFGLAAGVLCHGQKDKSNSFFE